ncbi:MAG: anti-sigma factor [Tuberibacillus sp.]
MACSNPINDLIDKVLDQEATEQEYHELQEHISICGMCRERFEELRETEQLLSNLKRDKVPDYFTEKIMQRISERTEKESKVLKWLKKHPLGTAASLFLVLMAGYIFSLWEQAPFRAEVQGSGKIAYEDHDTVVVPKDETIKGNLVVQNGKVKIEGEVDGNVILINSDSMLASAGHVTGQIEEVNQILEWIWYHTKQIFKKVFMIMPQEKGIGMASPFSF